MKRFYLKILNWLHRRLVTNDLTNHNSEIINNFDLSQIEFSIGITTFDKRFDNFFKPLISSIKKNMPNVEIVIMVNCAYQKPFDEIYRKDMLRFLGKFPNLFPHFCTEFRSLAKLWNNELIFSSNKYVLILNDDVSIDESFFENLKKEIIANKGRSFKLNGSWSHVFLNRIEVDKVGWFDERLLGVGEEDGDFEYRWNEIMNEPFKSVKVNGIFNHVDETSDSTIAKHSNSKYSLFNRSFIQQKYKINFITGKRFGIFDNPLNKQISDLTQYGYENFFWENKKKL